MVLHCAFYSFRRLSESTVHLSGFILFGGSQLFYRFYSKQIILHSCCSLPMESTLDAGVYKQRFCSTIFLGFLPKQIKEGKKNVICRPRWICIGKNCALGLEYSPWPAASGHTQDLWHIFSQYGPLGWQITYLVSTDE